ncbi:restriction endonuclease subunit S [Enterococcus faecium]|uniref:restriction endonuclease subunit S n=3 Tax=Enterococcus faecium TaxID=1352 RepID=UPI0002A25C98|nr:restriction endonuclease subunit S [Enterococcus faecium]ELA48698.1 hypothetical protein OG9_04818 [Enterococcus faecium EnGen0005]ELB62848.1 hypothetical protein OKY_04843 [Enterococcus faecium EnGen0048]EOG36052.1 hypothetical protein SMS_01820 [Enterococcus faecium EnGen0184]EOM65375.1 hypothetical protein SKE_02221 [Enterococcus faecium EnGen0165]MBD9746287.1 restriction endonuclease subunit S [Enterococcus faecium]
MSNDTLPEIRFPEFTDEWEQRKLGDESDVRDGTHDSPKYYDKGYPLVTSKNLKDFGLDLSNVSFISDEDFEVINKRSKVDIGDILFGMIGTIGNPVLVDRADFAIKNVALIKEQKKILNSFLIQILKSPVFDKYIKNENAGGTQKFLSLSKVRDFNFLCPNIDEQSCISAFFKKLDDTIALHQRKLDLLKETKKGFLQKMFPKNGAKVPEIRFPGFTEDWEERKLSDIADKAVDNRGKTPTISEDGNHPLLEVASLGNGAPDYSKVTKYLSDETFIAELRAYIKEGDILFSTVGSIGLVSLMDTNENAAIAQNIVAFRANEKYDSKFLYAMLSTKDNQHKAQRIVMGAVQPSIKVSQLVDVDYCVTENMEEQRKLGEYFLNLDNLITLHQRKLDLLKETKKGFLQKMFV